MCPKIQNKIGLENRRIFWQKIIKFFGAYFFQNQIKLQTGMTVIFYSIIIFLLEKKVFRRYCNRSDFFCLSDRFRLQIWCPIPITSTNRFTIFFINLCFEWIFFDKIKKNKCSIPQKKYCCFTCKQTGGNWWKNANRLLEKACKVLENKTKLLENAWRKHCKELQNYFKLLLILKNACKLLDKISLSLNYWKNLYIAGKCL